MLKFATVKVTSSVLVPTDASPAQLQALAHKHHFDFTPRQGYLYVRSRAISSRTNDNYDEFPAEEIEQAYRTFIGKPVFVNHNNDNHKRARGVVIDAALHRDRLADGAKDTWCEVLMEVDALRFPKLAEAIRTGRVDRTSMGCDVAYSLCSMCGNKATTPAEYCNHIPRLKGKKVLKRNASTGAQEEHLIRETCFGLKFFENSLLVEEPADPTAFFTGVDDHSGLGKAAVKTAATAPFPHPPRRDEYHSDFCYGEHQDDYRGGYGTDPEAWQSAETLGLCRYCHSPLPGSTIHQVNQVYEDADPDQQAMRFLRSNPTGPSRYSLLQHFAGEVIPFTPRPVEKKTGTEPHLHEGDPDGPCAQCGWGSNLNHHNPDRVAYWHSPKRQEDEARQKARWDSEARGYGSLDPSTIRGLMDKGSPDYCQYPSHRSSEEWILAPNPKATPATHLGGGGHPLCEEHRGAFDHLRSAQDILRRDDEARAQGKSAEERHEDHIADDRRRVRMRVVESTLDDEADPRDDPSLVHLPTHPGHPETPTYCNRRGPQYRVHTDPSQATCPECVAQHEADQECDHPHCQETGFEDGWHTKGEHEMAPPAHLNPYSDEYQDAEKAVRDALADHPLGFLLDQNHRENGENGPTKYSLLQHFAVEKNSVDRWSGDDRAEHPMNHPHVGDDPDECERCGWEACDHPHLFQTTNGLIKNCPTCGDYTRRDPYHEIHDPGRYEILQRNQGGKPHYRAPKSLYGSDPIPGDLAEQMKGLVGEDADWLLGQQSQGPTRYSRLMQFFAGMDDLNYSVPEQTDDNWERTRMLRRHLTEHHGYSHDELEDTIDRLQKQPGANAAEGDSLLGRAKDLSSAFERVNLVHRIHEHEHGGDLRSPAGHHRGDALPPPHDHSHPDDPLRVEVRDPSWWDYEGDPHGYSTGKSPMLLHRPYDTGEFSHPRTLQFAPRNHEQSFARDYLHPDRTDAHPNRLTDLREDDLDWDHDEHAHEKRTRDELERYAGGGDLDRLDACPHTYPNNHEARSFPDEGEQSKCKTCGNEIALHATTRPSEIGQPTKGFYEQRGKEFFNREFGPVTPLKQSLNSGSHRADDDPRHSSADEWTTCDQGHRHWGSAGAAGLLIRHTGDDGTRRYLLQHRAPWVDQGDTWGIPGGALHHDESPEDGAIRESHEELGGVPHGMTHVHTHSDEHGGWAFHTVVMDSPSRWGSSGGEDAAHETGEGGTQWYTPEEMKGLDLHPGFAKTWDSHLKKMAAFEDEPCPECGKPNDHIHLDQRSMDVYRAIGDAAQRASEMQQHAEKRVVNLSDPVDLKQHLIESHYLDDGDLWRNSHDEDHPALGPATDEDRPLTHKEIRDLHLHDHRDSDEGMPGQFLDESHFHTAVRKTAVGGPNDGGTPQHWQEIWKQKKRDNTRKQMGWDLVDHMRVDHGIDTKDVARHCRDLGIEKPTNIGEIQDSVRHLHLHLHDGDHANPAGLHGHNHPPTDPLTTNDWSESGPGMTALIEHLHGFNPNFAPERAGGMPEQTGPFHPSPIQSLNVRKTAAEEDDSWLDDPCDNCHRYPEPHTWREHFDKNESLGLDAWGKPKKQPYDGHGAWDCNNYDCTEHPQHMYEQGVGMPGWMKHDLQPTEEKDLGREIGRHFHETEPEAGWLLDQKHQGPTKYSSLQATASNTEPIALMLQHWDDGAKKMVGHSEADREQARTELQALRDQGHTHVQSRDTYWDGKGRFQPVHPSTGVQPIEKAIGDYAARAAEGNGDTDPKSIYSPAGMAQVYEPRVRALIDLHNQGFTHARWGHDYDGDEVNKWHGAFPNDQPTKYSAVGDNSGKGLVRHTVPAEEVGEGDFLDISGKTRVHKTMTRGDQVTLAWRQRGSKAPGIRHHDVGEQVHVWRRGETTAVRKEGTWIGDSMDEPSLFWRAPKTKRWEVHIHDNMPDRSLREQYGAKPSQSVTLYHADQMSPPHPGNPGGRPRGGWDYEAKNNRFVPNAWGAPARSIPDHVMSQVYNAQAAVDKHAENHADLYGQMAEQQDIRDDLARVPSDMASEQKAHKMMRHLLKSADEDVCPDCDGEPGHTSCAKCDGKGYIRREGVRLAAGPKRFYAEHPSGYRAEWTGGSRIHIYQGDAPVDSPGISGFDQSKGTMSDASPGIPHGWSQRRFEQQFHRWVRDNGDAYDDFNHPLDKPSYGERHGFTSTLVRYFAEED
jgi:8-oxo-dGTP pyrophosphatase MutT (NUDIX family)